MSWPVAKLGDHVQVLSGFAFNSKKFSNSEGVPLIRIRDVVRGFTETFYDGEFDDKYLINQGDLLVVMDGQFNAVRWGSGKALLNQRVCKIETLEKLDERYLSHLLPNKLKKIEDRTAFVTVKHLSVKKIKAIEFPLPPIAEQKRIAAILDKADVIKKEANKSQDLHKSLVLSLFRNMFGDPLLNPMGWEKVAISELIEKMHQGINTAADKVIYANSGIPIIQSKHIENGKILLESARFLGPSDTEKYIEKYTVLQNDILFSNIGTIGKTAIADNQNFMFAWNVFLFRLRIERISTIFFKVLLDYLVTAEYFERFMTGGTVKFVNKKTIAKTEIPLPPLELQLEFASLVNHLTHIFDSIDYGVEQKIELASSSIQSLIA